MEAFKDYFLCAVGISLLVEYARYLVADKFRPYVKFICSLFVVLMIAGPAYGALSEFLNEVPIIGVNPETEITQGDYTGYIDTFRSRLTESVSDCIVSNTDLAYEDFGVEVIIDGKDPEGIKISLIKVTLYKNYDCRAINNVVSLAYSVETETVVADEKSD